MKPFSDKGTDKETSETVNGHQETGTRYCYRCFTMSTLELI